MIASPIPLTIVGGYLGSGKTTLLSELLAESTAGEVGVIVNDFGELDFDAQLLAADGGDVVAFSNGCICCSPTDGMSAALSTLKAHGPRRVIVEASGVADPAVLARWAGTPGFVPGGIIVCVNAGTLAVRLRNRWVGETVLQQLKVADVIVVTHADVVSEALLNGALFLIGAKAPHAAIVVRRGNDTLRTLLAERTAESSTPRPGTRETVEPHAAHETWTVRSTQLLRRDDLEQALRALPAGVMRVKGFARFTASPHRYHAVHAAGGRITVTETVDLKPDLSQGMAGDRSDDRGGNDWSTFTVIAAPGTSREIRSLAEIGLSHH